MITKMMKYTFALLSSGTEQFLSRLQELGVVDITRSTKPVDENSMSMLDRADALKKRIVRIEKDDFTRDGEYLELKAKLEEAVKQRNECAPWGSFDAAMVGKLGAEGIKLHFYAVSPKQFEAEWENLYPLHVINADARKIYFVIVGAEGETLDFPIKEADAPSDSVEKYEKQIDLLQRKLEEREKILGGEKALIPELKKEYSGIVTELDLYLAGLGAEKIAEDYITVFTGFAPVEDDNRLREEFDKLDAYYVAEAAIAEEQTPIKLKNNKFVRMFEVLTDMYGRPAYDEFDPTPYISIFFMLFFAFCMGDAGYGLILVIAGLMLKKSKSFGNIAPLVVTLGGSTVLIGFLFHTFFSMDIAQWSIFKGWKCFLPAKIMGYDGTMVLALMVGIVHISVAMLVKAVVASRQKGFFNCLGTWGWTFLIVGGVIVGAFSLIGVLDAAVTKWVIIGLGTASAIGIFLLNDLHRNPLLNIGSGLWETYNTVTGLLGDVLSYLRLYALGLAGAMLGLAFNNIGNLILGDGSNAFLWLPFVLVVVVGHSLNIAMAALGAFVHPLRLNFLEFFKNSGYGGSGRKYNPLRK